MVHVLDLMDEKMKEIEEIVKASVPEIQNIVANAGGGGYRGGGGHTGELRISLKPQSQRNRSSEQIAADLQKKIGQSSRSYYQDTSWPGNVHA